MQKSNPILAQNWFNMALNKWPKAALKENFSKALSLPPLYLYESSSVSSLVILMIYCFLTSVILATSLSKFYKEVISMTLYEKNGFSKLT